MMIATPIGYPSDTQPDVDINLRKLVKGDEALPTSQLFFMETS